jgi:hypothetical protein
MSFDYLLEKVKQAEFTSEPFTHIQINNFFSDAHFREITAAPEIAISNLSDDADLIETLFKNSYKIIDFPGCIIDKDAYLDWHKERGQQTSHNNSACEGFGMTLRLYAANSPIVQDLMGFINGAEFQETLATKFGIGMPDVFYDSGIQKYLDGYEISPHPDIRKKALTYMVNINPGTASESQEHHTHYMRFNSEFKYVQAYWEGRPEAQRCWVPWDWCTTDKVQKDNNSIVIFSPANDTLHAVKTKYDHLADQRTQLYGNFWYHENTTKYAPEWEDLQIKFSEPKTETSMVDALKAIVPQSVKNMLKRGAPDNRVVSDRLKK